MYRIDFIKYSELGKVTELQNYLTSNTPPDKSSFFTALYKCIETRELTNDHLETIRLLIQYGADVTMKVTNTYTLLQLACLKGHLEVVKILLSHEANAKEIDRRGLSTVMVALQNKNSDPIEILKVLHEREANLKAFDFSGATALHYAAINGHRDSVEFLLRQKVDPNLKDSDQNTALQLAYKEDRKACIDLLFPVTIRNNKGYPSKDPDGNGKSTGNLNPKRYQKDEWSNNFRGRGKGKPQRGNKRNEKEAGECFSCKRITEVFCRDCVAVQNTEKSEDIKSLKEQEDCIRIYQFKIKELEKENNEMKELIGHKQGGYNIKSRLSPLFLKKFKERKPEQMIQAMQSDIQGFVRDQERFLANIQHTYTEAVNIFRTLITETLKNTNIEVFGSFSTGLLLPFSDVDLVITNANSQPIQILKELLPKIEELSMVLKTDKIFTASIPIIKIHIEHKGEEIKLDITVQENKHKGVECTNLVKKFLGMYVTIKQVYLVVKQLMFFCNFHEPYKGGISSYGLFLMVVYFYQEHWANWKFTVLDKEGKYADILCQFLEFYTVGFDYHKCIVVDYEGWDNKEFKNKIVSSI